MSTSPSWFDQEKFSRLVKKVGPKTVTELLPNLHGGEPENRSPSGTGLAPTARISLVSKPTSLLSDHRSLPALPRRTAPLPSAKTLLRPSTPPPLPEVKPDAAAPAEGDGQVAHDTAPTSQEEEHLAEVWHKMGLLNVELARAIQDRDQALNEGALLREQLNRVEEELKEKSATASPTDELEQVIKERDEALAESQSLREQLQQAKEVAIQGATSSQSEQVSLLTEERDQARRDYAKMRQEFETLKKEQSPKEEILKFRKEWERQIEELQQKIAERDQAIAALKISTGVSVDGNESLKEEVATLRGQLARAKEETSNAQRGLALSQKALQQTRDTLREATEGTSLSRHNFDNLKDECETLTQQNEALQAQNEQLSRDLAAAKLKQSSRLPL